MTRKFITGFSTIIILLQLLLISYISYIDVINLQSITSNLLISDNAITVLFKEGSLNPSLKEITDKYPKITILSEIYSDVELQIWGIIGESFLDEKTESFVKGRFLNKDDFYKKKFKAIIGENIISSNNYFKDKNGEEKFLFLENYYEVIGYLSSNISNIFDNTVFINLDSINIEVDKITIDGFDNSEITAVVEELKEKYDIDLIKEQDNFIDRYIYNDIDQYILNILIMTFIIVFLSTLFIFTLLYYKEEIKIKRIVGIEFKKILLNILSNITFLTVINTIFVEIIYSIIHYIFLRNIHISFYFYSIIIFSFGILAVLCLLMYLYMIITNNFSKNSGVR